MQFEKFKEFDELEVDHQLKVPQNQSVIEKIDFSLKGSSLQSSLASTLANIKKAYNTAEPLPESEK